jgi:predicted outer membrane repeat protein
MYNWSSSPTLTNCTFENNSATSGGGMESQDNSDPAVTNCILWGNTATTGHQMHNGASTPAIGYSDVQDGCPAGSTCDQVKDADPLFVDADTGDVRLRLDSPAIDAGDNRALPLEITTDLAGHARFVDVPSVPDTGVKDPGDARPLVDMGAYEAQYFTLSVTKAGSGSGTITSDPSGIDCGTDCTEALFQATVITLTATADTGSIFGG